MDYRDLIFYQRAGEVVKGVNAAIKNWPKVFQAQTISMQLFRAAVSVGANIAEGHGRHRGREYMHFLTIAQGSANEVDPWLNTALDCSIGNSIELQTLIHLNNETRKMLTSTIGELHGKQSEGKIMRESIIPYSPIPYPLQEDDQGEEGLS